MQTQMLYYINALAAVLSALPLAEAVPTFARSSNSSCRYLPGDSEWPSQADWSKLNDTVGGKLILGVPLAQPCYGPDANSAECTTLQKEWLDEAPYLSDPITVMPPYWLNNSCDPFSGPNGTCTLGNLASYAINVTDADSAIAGVRFAQEKNIRLTIKNTGHDFLGRSTGKGSLGLWMHNIKDVSFSNYTSGNYSGPAVKVGAGVINSEVYEAVNQQGLRVVGGSCPTVGVTGGFTQNGGHGLLASEYGLGADQTLEFDVVTATGQHLTASQTQNSDLYWALSGGGAGNYAIVLSVTLKAYKDGPIAGTSVTFLNSDPKAFWAGISAWLKHQLVLSQIPGFNSLWLFTEQFFQVGYTTLPGGSKDDMDSALAPFIQELKAVNQSFIKNDTQVSPNFETHYNTWATQPYPVNTSVGGRLISRDAIEQNLTGLVSALQDFASKGAFLNGVSNNVSHARVGNTDASNAVFPAWRDSLFTLLVVLFIPEQTPWDVISSDQVQLNGFQDQLKALTPGGGGYIGESTYDNPDWKEDYFGVNYDKLLPIKRKYDPQGLLWANTAVGNDQWAVASDGRLCST